MNGDDVGFIKDDWKTRRKKRNNARSIKPKTGPNSVTPPIYRRAV